MTITYREPMLNYYVHDVNAMAAFYCDNFGFRESFRIPQDGAPLKVEVRLGDFLIGFGNIEVAKSLHSLPLNPGLPRSELVLWADDVDEVYEALTAKGVRCISEPHSFLESPPLRAAFFMDPEGNHIQIVCRRPS
jgi:catechol 2,3-dioxygenase-like lactoylglutathione lyase family enzyme